MRSSVFAAIAATTLALSAPAMASERLEAAVEAAVVARSEVRFVNVNGHEFHIQPPGIQYSRQDGERIARIRGRLSHHLSARTDDQYYYDMRVTQGGMLSHFSERINRGGLTAMINSAVGRQPGSRFRSVRVLRQAPNIIIDNIGQSLGRRIDGDWEGAARTIAAAIAAEVAENMQPRRRDMRTRNGPGSGEQRQATANSPSQRRVIGADGAPGMAETPDLRLSPPEEDEAAQPHASAPNPFYPELPAGEPPSGLRAARSGSTVSLTWRDNSSVEAAWEIAVAADGRQLRWVRSGRVENAHEEHIRETGRRRHIMRNQPTAAGLCYRIRAVNVRWTSDWSEVACVR